MFLETFSLVIKPQSIRAVLSITIENHWEIQQLDVKTHGEQVFMHQPKALRTQTDLTMFSNCLKLYTVLKKLLGRGSNDSNMSYLSEDSLTLNLITLYLSNRIMEILLMFLYMSMIFWSWEVIHT